MGWEAVLCSFGTFPCDSSESVLRQLAVAQCNRDASYEGVLSAFDNQCHPHVALVREDPWHCIKEGKPAPSGVRTQCIYNVHRQEAWNLPMKPRLPLLSVCFNCVPPLQHAVRGINAPPITSLLSPVRAGKCQLRAS